MHRNVDKIFFRSQIELPVHCQWENSFDKGPNQSNVELQFVLLQDVMGIRENNFS